MRSHPTSPSRAPCPRSPSPRPQYALIFEDDAYLTPSLLADVASLPPFPPGPWHLWLLGAMLAKATPLPAASPAPLAALGADGAGGEGEVATPRGAPAGMWLSIQEFTQVCV